MAIEADWKERAVRWLLQHAFDEEREAWPSIAPEVAGLVDEIGNKRFRKFVKRVASQIDEVDPSAPADQHARVMGRALAFIVRNIVLDRTEADGAPLDDRQKRRLRDLVAKHFDDPDPLFTIVRVGADHPRSGDDRILEAFLRLSIEEESSIMPGPTDLSNFAFDTSGLPEKFGRPEFQDFYVKAVTTALEKLGNPGPIYTAATIGLLLIEGQTDPESPAFFKYVQRLYTELSGSADPDHQVDLGNSKVYYPNNAQRVGVYAEAFDSLMATGAVKQIFYQDFARLGRKASDAFKRRPPGSPGFDNMVRTLFLSGVTGDVTGDGGGGGIGRVELPPLNDPGGRNDEIEPDNIRAVATIYVSYQLEQMRFFQVTDRVVELFMVGLLPIGYDEGARKLDTFYWASEDRLSEAARWSQFSRALGASGGQISQDVNPNTDFNTLLLRFISAVSEFERQQAIGNLFDERGGGMRTLSLTGEYVRKAGRDLAANVSLYGWAGTYFAAERLAHHIAKAMEILQLSQVREAYGVATPWQVIERVAQREFGTTVNVVKHRTLAEETRKILNLIADKHAIWGLSSDRPLLSLRPGGDDGEQAVADFLSSAVGGSSAGMPDAATTIRALRSVFGVSNPNAVSGDLSFEESQTLFRAVQYWLAVNGVQDSMVDEFRQPTETVAAPSLPPLGGGIGATNGANAAGISQLRNMVSQGQMPSMDQLRSLLPGT